MGWLIAVGILALIALMPVGVRVRYDAEGFFLAVIAGPVRIRILPRKEKTGGKERDEAPAVTPEAPSERAEPEPVTQPPPAPKEKKPAGGGSLKDFLPLVRVALDFLGEFRRKLRVDNLRLDLMLAGDDPCDLSVNYGRAWAAVGNLLPQLERIFVIKKRDIQVRCDFCGEETKVVAGLDLSITIGRALSLLARYGFRAIREYLKLNQKRKGGAAK